MMQAIDASRREAILPSTGAGQETFELRTGFQRTLSGGGEGITDSTAIMRPLRKTRRLAPRTSGFTIATTDDAVELEFVSNEYLSRLRDEVNRAQGLTSEEAEADRALCAMLEIEPEQLAIDRLEQLRRLWA